MEEQRNVELFQLVRLVGLRNASIGAAAASSTQGLACLALYCTSTSSSSTSRSSLVVRLVTSSGVPLVRHLPWFRGSKAAVLDMCWCPDGRFLLLLTADTTLMLLPVAALLLARSSQPPGLRLDDLTVVTAHTKATKEHSAGRVFWWRCRASRRDVAVSVSQRGTVRFLCLRSLQAERAATVRTNLRCLSHAELVHDPNSSSSYLLLQSAEQLLQLVVEQEVRSSTFLSILQCPQKAPFLPVPLGLSRNRTTHVSLQHTARGPLVCLHEPSAHLLEVYNSDLGRFPLFVYRLPPSTQHVLVTDRFLFAVLPRPPGCLLVVLSAVIASTSARASYASAPHGAAMQHFLLPSSALACLPSSSPQAGPLLLSRSSVLQLLPHQPPERLFFRLLAMGLEKSHAEPLGIAAGLDLLRMYEAAGDRYFQARSYGRALDLYYLSNISTAKLVASFLDIGRVDIVVTHLRSALLQPQALSAVERKQAADMLLRCYVLASAWLHAEADRFFDGSHLACLLATSPAYDARAALATLLASGLTQRLVEVWTARGLTAPGMAAALDASCLGLAWRAVRAVRQAGQAGGGGAGGAGGGAGGQAGQEQAGAGGSLLASPLAAAVDVDQQVLLAVEQVASLPLQLRRIRTLLPLLRPSTLLALARAFDPLGRFHATVLQAHQALPPHVFAADPHRVQATHEYTELFLAVLLTMWSRRATEQQEGAAGDGQEQQEGSVPPVQAATTTTTTSSSTTTTTSSSSSSSPGLPGVQQVLYERVEAKRVASVACGWKHAAAVTHCGQLWMWGSNSQGQAGAAGVSHVGQASPVALPLPVASAACGGEHSLAVDVRGGVWAWGSNSHGQLGLGSSPARTHTPTPLPPWAPSASSSASSSSSSSSLPARAAGAACGFHHSLVREVGGEVLAFGAGLQGELGVGRAQGSSSPLRVAALHEVEQVACGWAHAAALCKGGQLLTWGSGVYGQLGHGDQADASTPTLVQALLGKRVRQVACGSFHTLAVSDLQNLYTWGRGNKGRLGHGSDADCLTPTLLAGLEGRRVTHVAGGYVHSLAVTQEGGVYAWGSSAHGQLGLGAGLEASTPRHVQALHASRVSHVAAGEEFSLLLADDRLQACGSNLEGQLGAQGSQAAHQPQEVVLEERATYRSPQQPLLHPRASRQALDRLLFATLAHQRHLYRPSAALAACLAHAHLPAASLLHELAHAWLPALELRLACVPDEPEALLALLSAFLPRAEDARQGAALLHLLFARYHAAQLPLQALELRLAALLPAAAPALALALEQGTCLALSSRLCLAATKACLVQMRSQLADGKEQATDESRTWTYVEDNLAKDLRKRALAALPSLRVTKLLAGSRKAFGADAMAFSCGHCYGRAHYLDHLLADFSRRMAGLPRPLPTSAKLLLDDFHQQHVTHACPVCVYNAFAQEQPAASRWTVA